MKKKIKKIASKKVKGYTMAELLVVLAIIGILVSLAVPKFQGLISDTKALEAKLQLKHLLQLQKNYFFIHSKYSNSLDELGFEQAKLVTQDGTANYKIDIIEASNRSFKGQAMAVTDFDQDGQLNQWQVDAQENIKEVIKD